MIDYDDWAEKPVPEVDSDTEPFWTAASEGELHVQRCNRCGERQLYPRSVCRHCLSQDLEFEPHPGTGVIYSYAENHVPGQPGYAEETPYVVALVELDLAEDNPSGRPVRLMTHVVECAPEEIDVDMEVVVTFRKVATDPEIHLPVFRPD